MGGPYGLLSTGFVPEPTLDVLADIQADIQATFGASTPVNPESIWGQLAGIFAEREGSLWELMEAVYAAFDPAKASGQALDALSALTGTYRLPATASIVTATLTGTPATVVPGGSVASVAVTAVRFDTATSATIVLVPAWANTTPYVAGNRVNAGGKVWQCTHAGTSSASPTGNQGSTFTDGALTWLCLGTGTGAVDVSATCELTGPTPALSGTLTTISSPISGWSSVFNVLDAVVGQTAETDAELRIRRVEELEGAGSGTVDAIRSKILLFVSGVTACSVFENPSDVIDGVGRPPHSIEAMVTGGAAQDIVQEIWDAKGGGINTFGNQTPGTAVDSQGNNHTINWSRPIAINVYVVANVLVDQNVWPNTSASTSAVQALVQDNLLAYGEQVLVSDYDVFSGQLASAIMNGVAAAGVAGVPGMLDPGQPSPLIGTAPAPGTTATISVDSRHQAFLDSSRITVNVTYGSP